MQMDVFSQTGIVELVKIELGQRNVWRYFRKFRIYDVQVNFAIPPIFYVRRWLWESYSFFKLVIFYHFINQLVRGDIGFLDISRQSLV